MTPLTMKILQLISSIGYFGAENVIVQLSHELNNTRSCEVASGVIKNLAAPHVEVADESKKLGIESVIFPCRGKFDLNTLFQLRRFCKGKKIDIIHSHGYKANLYAFFSTLSLPIALVATCHNWLGDDPKMKLFASLDRFFLRNFSYIATVSVELRDKIIQGNISPKRITTIRNGIDLTRFEDKKDSGKLKSALGIPEQNQVIGTVGRISAEKGHVHFLNQAKTIEKEHQGTTFLIVGDGELQEELQKKYREKNIIFTGLRSDLPELYDCMDIFVLPSLTEGLPMVLLEAMASRLPVVATAVGSVPDLVKDHKTGFLVEPADEKSLQDRLLYLLREPEKRRAMGEAAYYLVKEGYSSAMMAKEYLSVYRQVITGKK